MSDMNEKAGMQPQHPDLAALRQRLDSEFAALVARIDSLWGMNNAITPHVQTTRAAVMAHLDNAQPVPEDGGAPHGPPEAHAAGAVAQADAPVHTEDNAGPTRRPRRKADSHDA